MEDGLLKQFGDAIHRSAFDQVDGQLVCPLQYKYIQTSQGLETGYTE